MDTIDALFIGGLAVLLAHLWALSQVWRSAASAGSKLAWSFLLLLFPLLGVVNWLVMGPRAASAARH